MAGSDDPQVPVSMTEETRAEGETPMSEEEAADPSANEAGASESQEPSPQDEAQAMSAWTESYSQWMSPLGHSLDEVDFDGMSPDRCRALQSSLRAVEKNLDPCPDKEVEAFLESALPLLHGAANSCRDQNEQEWAENLVEAKRLTHQAQVLLDKKYRFAGISELELESAIGVQRSAESISGRWLQAQQGDFFDLEGEAGEDDFAEDFEDSDGAPGGDFEDFLEEDEGDFGDGP